MPILAQTVPIQYDTPYSPYAAKDWRAAFADVARQELTGVELAIAYPAEVDANAVLAETGRYGLAIVTLSTGQICGLDGQFLTAADKDARRRAAESLRGHIRLSAKLGRPHVTVGLLRGGFGEEAGTEELLAEMLRPLCEMAENEGVRLQIEPINRTETDLLHTTQAVLDFLHGLNMPKAIGLLFDSYHSDWEDPDLLSAARAALPVTSHVHFADRGRLLPGEGGIDFPALTAFLLGAGYAGAFALETRCLPSKAHVLAHYGKSFLQATKTTGGRP
ncbi:MAG: sugar phosphate isomerase/epimerase [Clostridiales bacterium]|nr:sugar phosphate isomerase/epimerase [Clostridiales bacterium]